MIEQIWTLNQGDTLHVNGPATVTAQQIGNRRNRRVTVCVKAAEAVTVTVTPSSSPAAPQQPGCFPASSPTCKADNKPG